MALAVTGSARKAIVSDLITWTGTVTARNANLVNAYDALKLAADKTKDFLITNCIARRCHAKPRREGSNLLTISIISLIHESVIPARHSFLEL